MLDQRDAASVLATWRDVERRLSDARLSTDEAVSLADESARLRVEYRRVTDLVLEQYRSQQDRWPRDGRLVLTPPGSGGLPAPPCGPPERFELG
jgi:hypothetical protein